MMGGRFSLLAKCLVLVSLLRCVVECTLDLGVEFWVGFLANDDWSRREKLQVG